MSDTITTVQGQQFARLDFIQKLYSSKGFKELFDNNLSQNKTYLQSYEELETIHTQIFGIRRYSCYQSFITSQKKK